MFHSFVCLQIKGNILCLINTKRNSDEKRLNELEILNAFLI
jgi:hypothetical protein